MGRDAYSDNSVTVTVLAVPDGVTVAEHVCITLVKFWNLEPTNSAVGLFCKLRNFSDLTTFISIHGHVVFLEFKRLFFTRNGIG